MVWAASQTKVDAKFRPSGPQATPTTNPCDEIDLLKFDGSSDLYFLRTLGRASMSGSPLKYLTGIEAGLMINQYQGCDDPKITSLLQRIRETIKSARMSGGDKFVIDTYAEQFGAGAVGGP